MADGHILESGDTWGTNTGHTGFYTPHIGAQICLKTVKSGKFLPKAPWDSTKDYCAVASGQQNGRCAESDFEATNSPSTFAMATLSNTYQAEKN